MKTVAIETKEVEKITDTICDCCGQSCMITFNDYARVFEGMELEAFWGYLSGKDEQKWTAQICEKCVDEKLSFIKFKKEKYNITFPSRT